MAKKTIKVKVYTRKDFEMLNKARELNPDAEYLTLMDDNRPTTRITREDGGNESKKTQKIQKRERSGEEETHSSKIAFYIFLALFIVGFVCTAVFWYLDNLTGTLLGFLALIWGLALSIWAYKKIKNGEEIGMETIRNLTDNQKKSWGLWGLAILFMLVLFIIAYNQDPMNHLIPYFIVLIGELRLGIAMYEVIKEQSELETSSQTKEKGLAFNKNNFIAQMIIGMILFALVIPMLMGVNVIGDLTHNTDPNKVFLETFKMVLTLVAVSGIVSITQLRRSADTDLDYDRTSIISYGIMIILPILGILILPGQWEKATTEGALVSGVVGSGGVDYFGMVYVAILDNPATQFSLVIILISSLSILIGKARGQAGGGNMVIGSLGVAGVPMIIALMAFVGKVEVPPVFLTIFDEGFAQLVFAISYTSVISLALALVGVFYEFVPSARAGLLDD